MELSLNHKKDLIIYHLLDGCSINFARARSGFRHDEFMRVRFSDKEFDRAVTICTDEARRLNYAKQRFK